jgi:hypothetical protein
MVVTAAFQRHVHKKLKDITEEDIMRMLETAKSGQDFLALAKLLSAKKGMTHQKWEELFHEKELRQSLRQYGISEDLVTNIVASLFRPVFQSKSKVAQCFSFDKHGKLTCTVCPEQPYTSVTLTQGQVAGKIIEDKDNEVEAFVVLLCKQHIFQIENNDEQLLNAIIDTVNARKQSAKRVK